MLGLPGPLLRRRYQMPLPLSKLPMVCDTLLVMVTIALRIAPNRGLPAPWTPARFTLNVLGPELGALLRMAMTMFWLVSPGLKTRVPWTGEEKLTPLIALMLPTV